MLTVFGWPSSVLLAVGLIGLGGLLAAWVLIIPRRLAPPLSPADLDGLAGKERLDGTDARLKLQNDLRTTALQAIAGLAALVRSPRSRSSNLPTIGSVPRLTVS